MTTLKSLRINSKKTIDFNAIIDGQIISAKKNATENLPGAAAVVFEKSADDLFLKLKKSINRVKASIKLKLDENSAVIDLPAETLKSISKKTRGPHEDTEANDDIFRSIIEPFITHINLPIKKQNAIDL